MKMEDQMKKTELLIMAVMGVAGSVLAQEAAASAALTSEKLRCGNGHDFSRVEE